MNRRWILCRYVSGFRVKCPDHVTNSHEYQRGPEFGLGHRRIQYFNNLSCNWPSDVVWDRDTVTSYLLYHPATLLPVCLQVARALDDILAI